MGEIPIIAVDAMGGDNAPKAIVGGSVLALNEYNIKIILVGDIGLISAELSKYTYDKNRLEIVHTSEVIENEETPTVAIKNKKDSSMVVGLNLVKTRRAGAFVSAGSTGALLTGATVIVGRIKGIERPALGTLLPTRKGYTFLIDAGANVDAKPNYLLQFGIMGSIYMENIMGIKKPKVGIINIGTEKGKGNNLVKEAYSLFEKSDLNFIGNAEAREIPLDVADVVVCDAFVGNVILKYTEGLSVALLSKIKSELLSGVVSKVGALLSKGAFKRLKKSFSPSEVGGAAFLGLKGLVVKAHGNSDENAIKNAVKQCNIFLKKDIINKIETKVKEYVEE